MSIRVDVDNRFKHHRAPTPVDHQPVIRMNRDTLLDGSWSFPELEA